MATNETPLENLPENSLWIEKELIPVLLALAFAWSERSQFDFDAISGILKNELTDDGWPFKILYSLSDVLFIKRAKEEIAKYRNNSNVVEATQKTADFRKKERCLYKYKKDPFPTTNKLFLSLPEKCNDIFEIETGYWKSLSLENNSKANSLVPRLLCLAEKREDPYMWTYYGGGHEGHCLEFEFQEIETSLKNKFRNSTVIYGLAETTYHDSEGLWKGKTILESKGVLGRLCSLFLKPSFLKQESEFRFVVFNSAWSNENTLVSPKVKSVDLGVKNPMNSIFSTIPFHSLKFRNGKIV